MLSYLFANQPLLEAQLDHFLAQDPTAIDEALLHKIMATLRGEDHATKSEFAFATLRKLVTSFQLNKSSAKMLKLLILFDKLVEDNLYCEEISKISLLPFEISKASPQQSVASTETRPLRLYWKIIREKAMIKQHDHIFHEKRGQRKHYFQRFKLGDIISQLATLETFFANIFDLISCIEGPGERGEERGEERGSLVEYVILHLLYKLLGLYNCQMMANKYLIHRVKELSQGELLKVRRAIARFREQCNQFIVFIKAHQGSRGFEHIHYDEIRAEANEKLLKFIDDYLQTLEAESMQHLLVNLPHHFGKIVVEKRPHANFSKGAMNPRLKQSQDSPKKQGAAGESNSFSNWHNNYSHEFPQKEVMTVDLILQIKLEESLASIQERQDCGGDNLYASRCSYDNRSTNITSTYEIHLIHSHYQINVPQQLHFESIFSSLEPKWNQF